MKTCIICDKPNYPLDAAGRCSDCFREIDKVSKSRP